MRLTKILPFAALTYFGCGTGETVNIASVHVKSQLIAASTGGRIDVSAAEHARLAGFRIDVPANALARDTTITVGFSEDSLAEDDDDAAGPTVELGPDGTQFSSPVTLTIPYEGAFDEDLVRVAIVESNGTRTVVLPENIVYDVASETVTFTVSHFTRFQGRRGRGACANVRCPMGTCRRGQCIPAADCSAQNACGPQPGIPAEMCADGSVGGFTGRCLPDRQSGCAWEIRSCPADCSPQECGPRPGAPNFQCPDGTIGGPSDCRRLADGMCGYEFIQCPTPVPCMSDRECGMGQCVNGMCSNTPPPPACTARECGPAPGIPNVMCSDGMTIGGPTACQRLADGSCGYEIIQCPPTACMSDRECGQGASCVNGACQPTGNMCNPMVPCARGETCDPATGRCIPQQPNRCMSDRDCGANELCDLMTNQCVQNVPPACMSDRECGVGASCVNGGCVMNPPTRCMSDRECGANEQCDAAIGLCVPARTPCMVDRQCAMGEFCDLNLGVCAPVSNACVSDRQCAPGEACVNGACTSQNLCGGMVSCPPNTTCDPATGGCVPAPVRCMSDRECAMGESCVNGACQSQTPNQCTPMECGPAPGAPNYLCPDGMTVAGPTDCRRLADGSCGYEIIQCPQTRCMSDSDCGANSRCVNSLCQ